LSPDQKQKLDEAAEELFDYVDNVKLIKDYFDELPAKQGIASPYTNFRDALFHYKKMYGAASNRNNFSFVQQHACVLEHLNRGLKDFAIHICNNYYIPIIHAMIAFKEGNGKDKETTIKLRKIYHSMKNSIVEIRITGQTLQHFDDNKNVWLPKLIGTIKAFHALLDNKPVIKRLYNQFAKAAG
jgi:hypothetical protein